MNCLSRWGWGWWGRSRSLGWLWWWRWWWWRLRRWRGRTVILNERGHTGEGFLFPLYRNVFVFSTWLAIPCSYIVSQYLIVHTFFLFLHIIPPKSHQTTSHLGIRLCISNCLLFLFWRAKYCFYIDIFSFWPGRRWWWWLCGGRGRGGRSGWAFETGRATAVDSFDIDMLLINIGFKPAIEMNGSPLCNDWFRRHFYWSTHSEQVDSYWSLLLPSVRCIDLTPNQALYPMGCNQWWLTACTICETLLCLPQELRHSIMTCHREVL